MSKTREKGSRFRVEDVFCSYALWEFVVNGGTVPTIMASHLYGKEREMADRLLQVSEAMRAGPIR
jgi:hypothetical protein